MLADTVRILQKIVDLNISDSSLDILGPASNILDRRYTESWENTTVSHQKVLLSYSLSSNAIYVRSWEP